MWENRVGEIARGSPLVEKVVRELGKPDPTRAIPADLVRRVTRLLDDAVGQYRELLGSSWEKRREAWFPQFVSIFKLLASRRLQEQHDNFKSFANAVRSDLITTMLLSERGFGVASGFAIGSGWTNPLFALLLDWSNQFELQWLERREPLRSALTPDPAEAMGDPLSFCKPRDPRAKDTLTARRIEQFRRRMEAQDGRKVEIADMVDFLGYRGPSMLQRVARERNASHASKEAVERMLRSPSPEEFWRVVDKRRSSSAGLR
jgi:hypothetical protein